jgi:hypothetical protein
MYGLTQLSAVISLAPCLSMVNNTSNHAGFLTLVPFLLQSHHGTKQRINHASSLGLQVFDVLTYSLSNCGLPCSSLIKYQQSLLSCGISASCTPCLLQSHHGSKHSIHHAYSWSMQLFNVLTYSLASSVLPCSSHINYQQSIWSCGIPGSCTMSLSLPSWLQSYHPSLILVPTKCIYYTHQCSSTRNFRFVHSLLLWPHHIPKWRSNLMDCIPWSP